MYIIVSNAWNPHPPRDRHYDSWFKCPSIKEMAQIFLKAERGNQIFGQL